MCKFCESLTDRDKEIIWNVRSTYADDNICEYINENECDMCDKCVMYFNLDGYKHDNNTYVGVTYNQHIQDKEGNEIIIRPFSEMAQFNYCPICGKQISNDVKSIEELNFIEIYDKE